MSTATIQEDITRKEFDDALQWDFNPPLTPGTAKLKLGMDPNEPITNRRDLLRRLGHPKYQTPEVTRTLGNAAQDYIEQGYRILPLHPRDKKPIIKDWVKQASSDLEAVQAWWIGTPDANIGLAIPARYMVLDVDTRHGGTLEALGEIPDTARAKTGGGGYHVWYKLPEGMDKPPRAKYDALPGIDIRHVGHQVVVEPSIHPDTGKQYEWIKPLGYKYENVAPIPDHLLDILQPPKKTRTNRATKAEYNSASDWWVPLAIDKVRKGATRNDTGLWLAGQLRDSVRLSVDQAETPMLDYQQAVEDLGDHLYTEVEAQKTLRSAYSQEAREPAHAQREKSAGECLALSLSSPDLSWLGLTSPDFSSRRIEFMRLSEEADLTEAEHLDDRRRYPGTPLYIRRQAQYPVIDAVWSVIVPGDILPRNLVNTWLAAHMDLEPGTECIQVVDCLLATYENHLNHGKRDDLGRVKPPRNPRAYYTNAIMHQLDPDYGYKRAKLKEEVKAIKAKEQDSVDAIVRVLEEPAA